MRFFAIFTVQIMCFLILGKWIVFRYYVVAANGTFPLIFRLNQTEEFLLFFTLIKRHKLLRFRIGTNGYNSVKTTLSQTDKKLRFTFLIVVRIFSVLAEVIL